MPSFKFQVGEMRAGGDGRLKGEVSRKKTCGGDGERAWEGSDEFQVRGTRAAGGGRSHKWEIFAGLCRA